MAPEGIRMDTWIRADYTFTDRRAVVSLATEQLWHVRGWKALLQAQDPRALADALTRLLGIAEDGRYAGAAVLALRYSLPMDSWEVSIMHAQLHAIPWGERAPEFPLRVTTADLHAALEPVAVEAS